MWLRVVKIVVWMNLSSCSLRPSCPAADDRAGITGIHRYHARLRASTLYHIAVSHHKPLHSPGSSPVGQPRWRHRITAPVTPFISDRHRANPNSCAAAPGAFKLSASAAPLGNYASNAPVLASDYPPEPPNFSLPLVWFFAPPCVGSPWSAYSRSVHAPCSLVSASLGSPDASRPIRLS
jgi:hypothetical protein